MALSFILFIYLLFFGILVYTYTFGIFLDHFLRQVSLFFPLKGVVHKDPRPSGSFCVLFGGKFPSKSEPAQPLRRGLLPAQPGSLEAPASA